MIDISDTKEEGEYILFGAKEVIRQDIALKVIDAVNACSNLKRRLIFRQKFLSYYETFYEYFHSLFVLSFPFLSKAIKYSKKGEAKEKKKKILDELERIFSKDTPPSPNKMIYLFNEYLSVLRDARLIDIGGMSLPFDRKVMMR